MPNSTGVTPIATSNQFSRINNKFNFDETRFGGKRESVSSAPFMIGDNFGSGLSQFQGVLRFNQSFTLPGQILATDINGVVTTIGYEFGVLPPHDIFTLSPGSDGSGDGLVDTYAIAEPTPFSDVADVTGPRFQFSTRLPRKPCTWAIVEDRRRSMGRLQIMKTGSSVTTTSWRLATVKTNRHRHRVSQRDVSRFSENYCPDVRDRIFSNYGFFNNAYGGLGDVSRFIIGFERVLVDDLVSLEMRMPYAATYASTQLLEQGARRALEPGNLAVLLKGILLRDTNYVWAGGLGVTVPTAEDSRMQFGGVDLLRVENKTVHLLPFTSLLYRFSPDFAVQVLGQLDVAANGDPVQANFWATKRRVAADRRLQGRNANRIGHCGDQDVVSFDGVSPAIRLVGGLAEHGIALHRDASAERLCLRRWNHVHESGPEFQHIERHRGNTRGDVQWLGCHASDVSPDP